MEQRIEIAKNEGYYSYYYITVQALRPGDFKWCLQVIEIDSGLMKLSLPGTAVSTNILLIFIALKMKRNLIRLK